MSFIPEAPIPEAPTPEASIPEASAPEASTAAPLTRRAKGRAARLARFEREQTIVGFLNRGVSIPEIAAKTGVGEKRMRAAVREILFRRMPKGPEEFAAIQASRLNEALLVAFSAMTDLNLQAVDRVVRIVRELDRYHGFIPAAARETPLRARPQALAPPADAALTFGAAAWICRVEVGPQTLAPCLPRASADDPLVLRSDAAGGASRRTFADRLLCPSFETPASQAPQDEEAGAARPANAAQAIENTESAPDLSACRPRAFADDALGLRSDAAGGASRRACPELVEGTVAETRPADGVLGPSFETPPPAAPQDEEARASAARPANAAHGSEEIESASELGAPLDIHSLVLRSAADGGASRRTFVDVGMSHAGTPADSVLCPSFETPPPAAPQDEAARARDARPANASQGVENTQSAPGLPPPFRPARVRMTANGMAAC